MASKQNKTPNQKKNLLERRGRGGEGCETPFSCSASGASIVASRREVSQPYVPRGRCEVMCIYFYYYYSHFFSALGPYCPADPSPVRLHPNEILPPLHCLCSPPRSRRPLALAFRRRASVSKPSWRLRASRVRGLEPSLCFLPIPLISAVRLAELPSSRA